MIVYPFRVRARRALRFPQVLWWHRSIGCSWRQAFRFTHLHVWSDVHLFGNPWAVAKGGEALWFVSDSFVNDAETKR